LPSTDINCLNHKPTKHVKQNLMVLTLVLRKSEIEFVMKILKSNNDAVIVESQLLFS